MSYFSRLVIEHDETKASLEDILQLSGESPEDCMKLAHYLKSLALGAKEASLLLKVGAVKASLAGTFSGAPTASNTITINGVAFTARTSGAVANEFNIGGNVTATAAAFAAAVNASTSAGIVGIVSASSSVGVVTIQCIVPGLVGNAIVVAESMDNFAWAGAATKLAGGTDGDAYSIDRS